MEIFETKVFWILELHIVVNNSRDEMKNIH